MLKLGDVDWQGSVHIQQLELGFMGFLGWFFFVEKNAQVSCLLEIKRDIGEHTHTSQS